MSLIKATEPATRQHGTVELSLTGADATGTPHRLHGDFTFTGIDNGVVRSASTRTAGASDVLELPLPAGLYVMTLNTEFRVEPVAPCTPSATVPQMAWVNPVKPPFVGVTDAQVTRVRFTLASANLPLSRAGNEPVTASDPTPHFRSSRRCSSARRAAEAETAATRVSGAGNDVPPVVTPLS